MHEVAKEIGLRRSSQGDFGEPWTTLYRNDQFTLA